VLTERQSSVIYDDDDDEDDDDDDENNTISVSLYLFSPLDLATYNL